MSTNDDVVTASEAQAAEPATPEAMAPEQSTPEAAAAATAIPEATAGEPAMPEDTEGPAPEARQRTPASLEALALECDAPKATPMPSKVAEPRFHSRGSLFRRQDSDIRGHDQRSSFDWVSAVTRLAFF